MTTPRATPSQVTLLPAQLHLLARIASKTKAAIGIRQEGSALHIDTGHHQFIINAKGETLDKMFPKGLNAKEDDHVH